jgi:DNA-directed RNA polymerase subunit RPC12/RpoP
MSTIVDCPTCTRRLNVPEEMLGRPVRCPDCGNTFEAGPGGVVLPVDGPDAGSGPPPAGSHGVKAASPGPAEPNPHMRSCPSCGRQLDEQAVHCRYCGEDLAEEVDRPWERTRRRRVRRDCEPHRGTTVLVLGILSLVLGVLGLPLGIVAWILGSKDLKKMDAQAMDPEGRGLTQAGRICGIVGTCMQSFFLLLVVLYFVFLFAFLMPMAARGPGVTVRTATPVPAAPPPAAPPVQPAPPNRPR